MKQKKSLQKMLNYIRHYKISILLSFLCSIVSVATQLYIPKLFGRQIDHILGPDSVQFVSLHAGWIRIIWMIVICALSTWIMARINNHIAYSVVQDLRDDAHHKIQTVPISYLDQNKAGDLVSCIIADAEQVSEGLLLGFSQLFSGIVTILCTFVFMIDLNLWITAMVLILTPLSFVVAKWISKHSYLLFSQQTKARDAQTAWIEEMIGQQKTVQAFGYEKRSSKRFAELNTTLSDYSQKAVFISSLTNPSTRFINNIIYALVALMGAWFILHGHLSVGGLSVLLAYSNQFMKPFNDISSVVTELQNALACADRIFSLLETEDQAQGTRNLEDSVQGKVDIHQISFSYTADQSLIRDFDLHIQPGKKVAFVGPTGCGKTTLIQLLLQFYTVQKGKICVDDQDISQLTFHALRSHFGMVLQDSWIKEDTIRENIRLGRPDATDEEVIEAAKEAYAWHFIEQLPQGLDTKITQESLSKGQNQLLCISRLFLASPPILILDEATSDIDSRTEISIQKAFDALMKGRTSIVIAHRLSTIQNADQIVVLKDGQIVETGLHEELLEKKGFYYNLYHSQFGLESA